MNKFFNYIKLHKIISSIALIVILGGGYLIYHFTNPAAAQTRYMLGQVEKGNLVVTVSGTGQVSNSQQIDLMPKASGQVVAVNVQEGQSVKAGQVLVSLDATNAESAVRNAQTDLESAQLSLDKILEPADQPTLLSAQNDLLQAQQASTQSQQDLVTAYDNGFSSVADIFVDMPEVITNMDDILYNPSHSSYFSDQNVQFNTGSLGLDYKTQAGAEYDKAKNEYLNILAVYKGLSRNSDKSQLENLYQQTYQALKDLSDAVKNVNNVINYIQSRTPAALRSSQTATDQSTLNDLISKLNTHLSDLSTAINNIKNDKEGITSAADTVEQKQAALDQVKAGANNVDIESAKLTVEQKQNALQDAENTLSDYYVTAPIDGILAKLNVNKGDMAGSGAAVATLITPQQIADISLNEVDVAKVKVGQKATLTFDALPDLNLTGTVVKVDTIGTVNQGVVTYNVEISFDVQDPRIKPGMSVSASIITDTKQDVLVVPSSAVKTSGNISYVQTLDGVVASSTLGQSEVTTSLTPRSLPVVIGASNDTQIEIASGLTEGENIITRSINGSSASVQTSSGGNLFGGGGRGGGAAGARFIGR